MTCLNVILQNNLSCSPEILKDWHYINQKHNKKKIGITSTIDLRFVCTKRFVTQTVFPKA